MNKTIIACLMCVAFTLGQVSIIDAEKVVSAHEQLIQNCSQESCPNEDDASIQYVSIDVPDIRNSFKAYMDYRKITDKTSNQYKYISQNAWSDSQGFMRADADIGIPDDYYLIALGSYYGTEIGTKYRITTDKGDVFYGVLADCKADEHTNPTNQYTVVGTPNVVEFIVDTKSLNKDVKYHGNAGAYAPLSGNIVKIERIEV